MVVNMNFVNIELLNNLRLLRKRFFAVLSALLISGFSPLVLAGTLEQVLYSELPSSKVQVNLKVNGSLGQPKIFSTQKPARIVFDFYETESNLKESQFNIKSGAVDSLNVVQVGNRTRVVMNLVKLTTYTTKEEDGQFIINVDSLPKSTAKKSKAKPKPFAEKNRLVSTKKVSGVDFRRTEKGGGSIVVDLSDPSMSIDLVDRNNEIIVDFQKATLDEGLEKRLDVMDFATPVKALDIFQNGNNVRIVVEPSGKYQQISFQKDKVFTVILDPIEKPKEGKKEANESGYSGERLSLNFQRLEVRSALSVIADFTGLNIVASDDVSGELTLNLKDVPWDQALDVILETKGLAKRKKGNVVWIAPAQRIAEFERQQLEAADASRALQPQISEVIEINYAKAEDIKNVILEETKDGGGAENSQQVVLLQSGGDAPAAAQSSPVASLRVTADQRTNSLIVTTTASNMKNIKALIAELDKPVRQVIVETRIVQASDTFSRELGARFGFQRIVENATAGGSNIGNSATSADLGGTDAIQQSLLGGGDAFASAPLNSDLGATGINGSSAASYAFSLYKAGAGYANILNLELSALEAEGRGKIVSSPRLVTSNQREASISTGETRFVTTTAGSGASEVVAQESRDALLQLTVLPQISPDDSIILNVQISQDNFTGDTAITRNNIQTQVTVENGETIIIGGIYQENEVDSVTKVPFLGDIPILGNAFKKKSKANSRFELLIFLTPKIIDGELNLS